MCPTGGGGGGEARCRSEGEADTTTRPCSEGAQVPTQALPTHTARRWRRTDEAQARWHGEAELRGGSAATPTVTVAEHVARGCPSRQGRRAAQANPRVGGEDGGRQARTVPATRLPGAARRDRRTAHRTGSNTHPGDDLDSNAATRPYGEGAQVPTEALAADAAGGRGDADDGHAYGEVLGQLDARCREAATVAVAEGVAHGAAELCGRGSSEADAQFGAEEGGGEAGAIVARIGRALEAAAADRGVEELRPTSGRGGGEARCRSEGEADTATCSCGEGAEVPTEALATDTAHRWRRTDEAQARWQGEAELRGGSATTATVAVAEHVAPRCPSRQSSRAAQADCRIDPEQAQIPLLLDLPMP